MTPAQLLTLKAAIAAETDPTFVALRNAGATGAMADFYNVSHATFVVWKTFVSLNAIGDKINGVEWANLTQLNVSRLQCMSDYAPQGVNPSLSDRRALRHARRAAVRHRHRLGRGACDARVRRLDRQR
jgi:hypothetical protein